MPPRTQYTKSGSVSIAYQVLGSGPIDLVYAQGWITHLEYAWENPDYARFLMQLSTFARFIRFDRRGMGLSDRDVESLTLEERVDDIRAVMDAVGSERAALFGVSEGGYMSVMFAATHPERTAALVLCGCYAKGSWAPDYPWGKTYDQHEEWVADLERDWGGDAVTPGKRFAVAGVSAGGHLVRGLTARCPDRLLGVLINAAPFVIDYAQRDLPEPSTIFEEDGFGEMAGDRTELLRSIQPIHDAALVDRYVSCCQPAEAIFDEAAAMESWQPENYAFSFDPDKVGAPFAAPSLILAGRQDTIVGYRDAWMSIERFPRATFATLDGCGHYIAPAKRDLFRSLVADWLDRMELEAAD